MPRGVNEPDGVPAIECAATLYGADWIEMGTDALTFGAKGTLKEIVPSSFILVEKDKVLSGKATELLNKWL